MGRANRDSLVKQVQDTLLEFMADGESKHLAKQAVDGLRRKIFAYSTLKTYMKHDCYFVKYCKKTHGCRTLEECEPYVDEWLESRFNLSAYTVKLEAAALAKLYGKSTTDFIKTPARKRADIKRSRGTAARDRHFSKENNKDFISFCKSTGLRRRELEQLRGDRLLLKGGQYYIIVDRGAKGGKRREAPVIGDIETVVRLMNNAGTGRVWANVPGMANVHGYRSEYATAIYKMYARPLEECRQQHFYNPERHKEENSSVYYFRKDRAGEWLDKAAMLEASKALGHNRISVVGEHYIR